MSCVQGTHLTGGEPETALKDRSQPSEQLEAQTRLHFWSFIYKVDQT